MSLKFFFARNGAVVLGLFGLGWILNLYGLSRLHAEWAARGAFTGTSYLIFIGCALLITLTRFIPWYGPQDRGFGIEEHFAKTLVPVAYILVIANCVHRAALESGVALLVFSAMLLVIQSVNFILIYFHRQDKDPTAPSHFSRQEHL